MTPYLLPARALLLLLQVVLLGGLAHGQKNTLDDVSNYNHRATDATVVNALCGDCGGCRCTPDQLPWIDFNRPAVDGFTCWELGAGQRFQTGDGQDVGPLRPGASMEFEVATDASLQRVDLSCLGGGRGLDGSAGVFSAGPGTPNYELLLVARPFDRPGDDVSLDLTPLLTAGGLTPQRAPPPGATTMLDAGAAMWFLRLRNLNRFQSISMDLVLNFDSNSMPERTWEWFHDETCDICNVGACADCKSCVGLGNADTPDGRCDICYAQTSGLSCLAADYSMCEDRCWSGRDGNVPVVLVNPMTASSLYMQWDRPELSAICRRRTDGLQMVWPPDIKDIGRIQCSLDIMKLVWDDNSQSYLDRDIISTVTTPSGAPPESDMLSGSHVVWGSVIDKLETELGYSALTQMRMLSYDWRMGARHYAQPGGAFEKAKQVFEDSLSIHGQPALAISFSMGSPFFHAFLQQQTQEWKDQHVAGWASLAGPFAGAVQLLFATLGGTTDIAETIGVLPGIEPSVIRDTLSSWGVSAFMAPRPTSDVDANSRTLAQIYDRTFTFGEGSVREILALAATVQPRGPAAGGGALEDSDSAQRTLEVFDYEFAAGNTLAAPHVPVWCIYSLGQDTPSGFTFNTPDMSDNPVQVNGNGDATVHAQSLQVCDSWVGSDPDHEAVVHQLPDGVVHGNTAKNEEVLDLLTTIACSLSMLNNEVDKQHTPDCMDTTRINTACPEASSCASPEDCAQATCPCDCAVAFVPWWNACASQIPDEVVASVSAFFRACSRQQSGGH
jgi:hypothetical protein